MLEDLCQKNMGEAGVACLHVDICKYENIGGSICKKIGVKLRSDNPTHCRGKSNK
jgi:hypothetical protein